MINTNKHILIAPMLSVQFSDLTNDIIEDNELNFNYQFDYNMFWRQMNII